MSTLDEFSEDFLKETWSGLEAAHHLGESVFDILDDLKTGALRGVWIQEMGGWRLAGYQFTRRGLFSNIRTVQKLIPIEINPIELEFWLKEVRTELNAQNVLTYLQNNEIKDYWNDWSENAEKDHLVIIKTLIKDHLW